MATGTVDVVGLWQGKLDSSGSKDQGNLALGGPLELPTAISGSVATTKEGKLSITPKSLILDFIPPADKITVNDDNPSSSPGVGGWHWRPVIGYSPQWSYSDSSEPARHDDYQQDVHWTNVPERMVSVTFVGTGLEYVTERFSDMGKVQIKIDNDAPLATQPNASLEADNVTKVTTRKSQQVLWSVHNLPYKEHTVTVTNKADPGNYMLLDAFNIITDQLSNPPATEIFRTKCDYVGNPVTATVDVVAASGSGDGSNGGNNGNNNGKGQITDGDDSDRGVIVLSGGGQGHGAPTATATATKTAKPTKTSKATKTPQVRVTPKGGAHTGEAPENGSAPLLIGYGTTLALGGVVGGLALRRRRAVHGSADQGNLG